jgi:glycosyltransferase involved in cell wall biosynthesis
MKHANKMMPQFSIIVPVYNAEKYLRRCLDSIRAQTFSDFECVLVDDGSTDGSFCVCETYVKTDERFRLFHQENSGVGAARQKGVSEARGVYSLHVDSDDAIDSMMLERVQFQLEKTDCDLLFMNYYEITPKERVIYRVLRFPNKSAYSGDVHFSLDSDAVLSAVLRGDIPGYIWFVVVRHNLYQKYNITFPCDIVYGEDTLVLIELLLNRPKMAFIDEGFYRYSFNPFSITHQANRTKHFKRIQFLEKLDSLLARYGRSDFLAGEYDHFKIDAKYEMLSDGVFTKNEYRSLLRIDTGGASLRRCSPRKRMLLTMAEIGPYFFACLTAKLIRRLRNLLK